MKFPITQIHQIEMTSHCNLRCRYCPSPKLPREKLHMSDEDYKQALVWVKRYSSRATQGELNLAGIGESTMHPEFVRNVFWAREALDQSQPLVLATNGLLMTDEMARAIAPTGIRVWVSLHRPEKAGPAVEALKKAGILAGISADPSVASINWAEQVKWHRSATRTFCPWVRGGWVFVMADGRVSRCCIDAAGRGVMTTIHNDLDQHRTSAYSLCETCDQDVGVPIPTKEAEVA